MAAKVTLAWLGHELRKFREQQEYEPEEYPPHTVDALVQHLASKLGGGFGDDLERAYSIGDDGD